MKNILYLIGLWAGLFGQPFLYQASADLFGSGGNQFAIDFVHIGSPGNLPDDQPNPAGAVGYVYRIGKYEVSEQMIEKANLLGGLGITLDDRGPDFPATNVTWFGAAKFVNWLNTSTSSLPAYKFDANGEFQLWEPLDPGYNPNNRYRNSQAKYFLPSVDEWHKAAYYDPAAGHYWDYPTGSDAVPDGTDFVGDPFFDALYREGAANLGPNVITDVGLSSPFSTVGQGGNVAEWEETTPDQFNDSLLEGRGVRGGGWGNISTHLLASNRNGIGPGFESDFFGFRVASVVPEPSAILILGISLPIVSFRRKR